MAMLRTMLRYLADRHSCYIALLFALFALFIVHCGDVGSAEVRLRAIAAASATTATTMHSATTAAAATPSMVLLSAARVTTISLVSLTEADVAMLQGGRGDNDGRLREEGVWTSATCTAWSQRWQRHFTLSAVTFIRLPAVLSASPTVVREALSCLQSLCVECHLIPVPETSTAADERETVAVDGTTLPSFFTAHTFCSASDDAGGEGESDVDVLLFDDLPVDTGDWHLPAVPRRCGVVALLTPTVMRKVFHGVRCTDGARENGNETANATVFRAPTFETILTWAASRVDPPLPRLVCSLPQGGFSSRQQRSERLHEAFVSWTSLHVARRLGYRPRFLFYLAWCSAARTLVNEVPPETLAKRDEQPVVHILCVRENEVVTLTPALQMFERVSSVAV